MKVARPGAAMLALETGCEVLPCGMRGTEEVWPRGGRFRFRWKAVTIRIGEPLSFRQYSAAYAEGDDETKKLIVEGVSTLIMRKVAELCGKEYTHGRGAVERLVEFQSAAG